MIFVFIASSSTCILIFNSASEFFKVHCISYFLNDHFQVESGSEEEKFARKALFKRHPDMQGWPEGKNCLSCVLF